MKFLSKICFLLLISGFFYTQARAQQQDETEAKSTFDKYEAFSPLFMEAQANRYHSATGKPGPDYWQNRANYDIDATLDTTNQSVTGSMTITYKNNSPYDLHFIWLQLDQNTFRKDSRGSAVFPSNDRNGVHTYTNGYDLENVSIDLNGNKHKADYLVNDTRMQIRLPEVLKGDGETMKISIDYSFKIPEHGKDRMGRVKTQNGWIYTIAQWYPRMEVMDEVEGWNTLPYLGTGEFYLEYGTFDYEITAPSDMLVVGSGKLQNPKDVLTDDERDQLEKARKSDSTITIRSKQDVQNMTADDSNGMKTWHFKMEQSHDIAWAASKAFIWDAARINLPDNQHALAQSVYPVESAGQDAWGRSTEYVKGAIELYSKEWFAYTYPVATNVAGNEGGMEYPGIVFCNYQSKGGRLWGVTNHEFGHNWFPMVVGSNERKYAWMDEGFNTFINDVDTKEFNGGEYYHKSNDQAKGASMFDDNLDPVFTVPDVIHNQGNLGVEAYSKPAQALHLLREQVLGEKRFDYAFRTYIQRWAFKHPTPWDFFNTMSDAAGEDLGWFWRGWIMNNWKLDQAVESVDYVNGDPKNGSLITLLNKKKMAMPVTVKIKEANGDSLTRHFPVEVWQSGPEWTLQYPTTSKIRSVEIDPEHAVPDINPSNNILVNLASAPQGVSADNVIGHYLDAIGGRNKLEEVEDMTLNMTTQIQGYDLNITEMKKSPGKYSQKMVLPAAGRTITAIKVNGDSVQVVSQGQTIDLSEKQKKSYQKQAVMFPELQYGSQGYNTELLGMQNIDGQNTYVVEITTPDGVKIKDYYAADSGLKLMQKTITDGNTSTTKFSDYQDAHGLMIPFSHTTSVGPRTLSLQVKDVKINSGLKDSNFQ